MLLRMDRLRLKQVIDIGTGDRLGFVGDVEIDTQSGLVSHLVIFGRLKLWGLLGREDDIIVPWVSIQRIGEDTVLVDGGQVSTEVHRKTERPGKK